MKTGASDSRYMPHPKANINRRLSRGVVVAFSQMFTVHTKTSAQTRGVPSLTGCRDHPSLRREHLLAAAAVQLLLLRLGRHHSAAAAWPSVADPHAATHRGPPSPTPPRIRSRAISPPPAYLAATEPPPRSPCLSTGAQTRGRARAGRAAAARLQTTNLSPAARPHRGNHL